MNSLLDTVHLCAFVNTLIHASTVFLATYTIGVLAVLGSSAVASYLPKTLINSVQQSNQSSISDTCNNNFEYVPSYDENSAINLEKQIENIILSSISEETGICNISYFDQDTLEKNAFKKTKEKGFNWLINSVSFLFPSNLNSNLESCSNHSYSNINDNNVQITETNYITKSNFSSLYSGKNVDNTKKLGLDLSSFSPNWRFYVCYISKTTLSY